MQKQIRIALDAMGGDFAPVNEISGAIQLYKDGIDNVEIIFVGNEELIKSEISKQNCGKMNYSVFHCDEVVTMKDEPSHAYKYKSNSSLYQGLNLVKEGKADAFVSAGNTGGTLFFSTMLLRKIKGVSRPTIGAMIPTLQENPSLWLDVGASADQKARFLLEYAIMGSLYFKKILNVEKPRVALLNVGEESSKGSEEVKEAYKLLQASNLNFIGNVEGRDLFVGAADVIVCDGFVGNIILKLAESFITILKTKFKNYADESLMNKIKIGMFVPTLKDILSDFDYQKYGGVPLLGVNGNVIIGHGKSTPLAFTNMLKRTIEIVEKDLNKSIEIELNQNLNNI